MALLDGIKEAITLARDAKTLDAVRERLSLAHDKLNSVEKELLTLKKENANLLKENETLKKQLGATKKEREYLDLGMCLIKRNPAGGYFDTPLCPKCKMPLSTFFTGKIGCSGCEIFLDPVAVSAAIKNAPLS